MQIIFDKPATDSLQGQVLLKELYLAPSLPVLDLSAATATQPALTALGADLSRTLGVVLHQPETRALDVASQAGMRRVRIDAGWSSIETQKGDYHFSALATRVQAIIARQMIPLVILDYNNGLYACPGSNGPECNVSLAPATQANIDAYAEFCRRTAMYFQGTPVEYELWNEPNTSASWTPTLFAQVVKQAAASIHSVDGNLRVMSGGLAGLPFDYIQALVSARALDGLFALAVHEYDYQTPERFASLDHRLRELLTAGGYAALPLYTTEVGASASFYGDHDGTATASRMKQAANLTRSLLTGFAAGRAFQVVYQLRDELDTPSAYDPFDPEQNYGLLANDYSEKPAKKAFDRMYSALSARAYRGVVSGRPTSLQAMRFSAIGQETVYVVWISAHCESATFSTSNDCAKAAGPCVVDVTGTPFPCVVDATSEHEFCTLSEHDGPLFVRVAE